MPWISPQSSATFVLSLNLYTMSCTQFWMGVSITWCVFSGCSSRPGMAQQSPDRTAMFFPPIPFEIHLEIFNTWSTQVWFLVTRTNEYHRGLFSSHHAEPRQISLHSGSVWFPDLCGSVWSGPFQCVGFVPAPKAWWLKPNFRWHGNSTYSLNITPASLHFFLFFVYKTLQSIQEYVL